MVVVVVVVVVIVVVSWLVASRASHKPMYLRDGSAETTVPAKIKTLSQKPWIKLTISLSYIILTPRQPVISLTL